MRSEKDTLGVLDIERSDDVAALGGGAIPEVGTEMLHDDGVAPTTHLLCQIVGAIAVSLGVGGAEPKRKLVCHILIGGICREEGNLNVVIVDGVGFTGAGFVVAATGEE